MVGKESLDRPLSFTIQNYSSYRHLYERIFKIAPTMIVQQMSITITKYFTKRNGGNTMGQELLVAIPESVANLTK